MACKKTGAKTKTQKKGKFRALLAVVFLIALCVPAFSAVPMTYWKGLKTDSLDVYGGGSFAGHVTFDWFSVDTFSGPVSVSGKFVVEDSLRVDKTSNFVGAMTATKITTSDSLISPTITTSGPAYFGSSSKFWKCITSGMWTANGVDSVFLKVDVDTFFINQASSSTTTKNVRLDGLLYLPNKVTADSISVTTLIANVWDTVTIAARYIDTTDIKSYWDSTASQVRLIDTTDIKSYFDSTTVNTKLGAKLDTAGYAAALGAKLDTAGYGAAMGAKQDTSDSITNARKAALADSATGAATATLADTATVLKDFDWGVGKGTGTKTIDTVLSAGTVNTSVIVFTPNASYTTPLYVSGAVVDTFFVTCAEADTAAFRASGYSWFRKR